MESYRIDTEALTIIRTDRNGEEHDLNSEGEPCEDWIDVWDLATALHSQGAFDSETLERLAVKIERKLY